MALAHPASEVRFVDLSRASASGTLILKDESISVVRLVLARGGKIIRKVSLLVKPTMFIIDDSVDTGHLRRTTLQTHNFYPVWAADGTQAMATARFHHPQAILLDLGLPGVDGLVALERLKSTRLISDIPVIVVTVRDRQEAEEKPRHLGAA